MSEQRAVFGWRFTAPLMLASTLNPINSSMLATGLVPIADEFSVGPGTAAILVSVLYLCSAIMQPTIGKLGTVVGQRRVFVIGLVLVSVSGVVGTVAPTFSWLLVSRALLGIGTSAAFPTAMAMIRQRADQAGTGAPTRVIGSLSIASQVCTVIGLPLGGLMVGLFGWRSLFALNIPLAIAAAVAVLVWVDRDEPRQRRPLGNVVRSLDLPGVVLFSGATIALLVFLGDLSSPVWWMLAAAVLLTAGLIAWERRALDPLIDVRALAGNPALARTYLRQLVTELAVYTALYGLSQWMGEAVGLDPGTVGLVMIPLSATSIVIARIASTRGWVRGPLIIGGVAVVAAGGLLLVVGSSTTGVIVVVIGALVLFGIANGFGTIAIQTSLYLQTPAHQIGAASGLLRTFGYVGAIFSSSLITLTFGARAEDAGLHTQGLIVGGLGILLVLLAFDRHVPWSTERTTAPSRRKVASSELP